MPYRADRNASTSAAVTERVRELRLARGMTQAQLSDAVTAAGYRIGRAVISRRESDSGTASLITVDELAAYADVLEVSCAELLDVRT